MGWKDVDNVYSITLEPISETDDYTEILIRHQLNKRDDNLNQLFFVVRFLFMNTNSIMIASNNDSSQIILVDGCPLDRKGPSLKKEKDEKD